MGSLTERGTVRQESIAISEDHNQNSLVLDFRNAAANASIGIAESSEGIIPAVGSLAVQLWFDSAVPLRLSRLTVREDGGGLLLSE